MARRSPKAAPELRLHPTHLNVKTDVTVAGTLCVGGDLEVHGDLTANSVYCFGTITVHGDIRVSNLYVGTALVCKGELSAGSLGVGWERLGTEYDPDESLDVDGGSNTFWDYTFTRMSVDHPEVELLKRHSFITTQTLKKLLKEREDREWMSGDPESYVIEVQKNLTCVDTNVRGNLFVKGLFDTETATIHGFADVGALQCDGELTVWQSLDIGCLSEPPRFRYANTEQAEVWVGGHLTCLGNFYGYTLEAVDIDIRGDCDMDGDMSAGDDIRIDGRLLATGNVKAGKYIRIGGSIASRGAIVAGEDYGVFAGLQYARAEWPTKGYVCAPKEPDNVLSGSYVAPRAKRAWAKQDADRAAYFLKPQ